MSYQSDVRQARFETAVVAVIARGEHPSAHRILKELGREPHSTSAALNGVECRWRTEILTSLGWTRKPSRLDHQLAGPAGRWLPPVSP